MLSSYDREQILSSYDSNFHVIYMEKLFLGNIYRIPINRIPVLGEMTERGVQNNVSSFSVSINVLQPR